MWINRKLAGTVQKSKLKTQPHKDEDVCDPQTVHSFCNLFNRRNNCDDFKP